jgi:hypothetical protein
LVCVFIFVIPSWVLARNVVEPLPGARRRSLHVLPQLAKALIGRTTLVRDDPSSQGKSFVSKMNGMKMKRIIGMQNKILPTIMRDLNCHWSNNRLEFES